MSNGVVWCSMGVIWWCIDVVNRGESHGVSEGGGDFLEGFFKGFLHYNYLYFVTYYQINEYRII